MPHAHERQSVWLPQESSAAYPPLTESLKVDVAVVGGGIAGLTTALRLAEAGQKVVVLEALTLGRGTLCPRLRKNHAQRDDEQDDAAGDAYCLLVELQNRKHPVSEEQEREQHDIRNKHLAHDNLAPPRRGNVLQN